MKEVVCKVMILWKVNILLSKIKLMRVEIAQKLNKILKYNLQKEI